MSKDRRSNPGGASGYKKLLKDGRLSTVPSMKALERDPDNMSEEEAKLLKQILDEQRKLSSFKPSSESDSDIKEIKKLVQGNSKSLADLKTQITVQGTRISTLEKKVSSVECKAEEQAEATGRQELTLVKAQLLAAEKTIIEKEKVISERKESAKHWLRYSISALIGLMIAIGLLILGKYLS